MRLLLIVGLLIVLPDVTSSQSTHEENAAPAEPAIENQIESLLELGKSMLRTAYHETSNRDSAKVLFQTAWALSNSLGNRTLGEESQCLLGIFYLLNGNWELGERYFMQVIQVRQRAGDKTAELDAWLRMATAVFCNNCDKNITALRRALELARQTKNRAREAVILLELGYKYLNAGMKSEAENAAMTALKIQESIGYPAVCSAASAVAMESVYYASYDYRYLSNAYYLLSDLGQTQGNLNQKLLYIFKVTRDVENSGMTDELDYTYFRLGNAYWELGRFEKSMEYHRQSMMVSQQKGELIPVGLARRMAAALVALGRPAEALELLHDVINSGLLCSVEDKMYIAQGLGACYNALRQYHAAERYYLESVAFSEQSPLRFQLLANEGIARFYIANTRYDMAEPYLRALSHASRQQILPNELIDVYLMQFKVDSARGDYRDAILHYQQYKALQDSMFNETKSQQIAQLSIEYETAKKEQDIKIKESDIALLKEQNKAQQNQRNALIVGTGLLAAVLGLGFNRYRLKQRVNRQLQRQQQILEMQDQQIRQKNKNLSDLIGEKDSLLLQKDSLLGEKDQLITEKEWLLKEIHHRVKNNFHIVASLLEIQSSYLHNKEALSAIRESQHRIHSMSIIHQKLYQSDTLSTIQMSAYIYELVEYLSDSYAIRDNIRFSLDIQSIELDHASAITLGLILNEIITNAIKYAFAKTGNGAISITLRHMSNSQILLSVQDNGPGLPADFNNRIGASMGMELLQGLTDDIGGTLDIESNNGTLVKIIFSYKAIATSETPA
ncbi:MAG TPA: sensor histidine kinase [Cyclobacteriaceae bacterium]